VWWFLPWKCPDALEEGEWNPIVSIGTTISRREDRRLLTGLGSFTDDEMRADQVYASIVRSPHAHAEISSVDCSAARRVPGVLGIFTAVDLQDDHIGTIP